MTWMKAIAVLSMSGAALGALTIGCSSTPDEVPPDPLAAEEGFCSSLAQAVCNDTIVSECYGSAASDLENDRASCVTNAESKFCNANNAVYRAVNAQGCIDAYAAAYGDARVEVAELESIAAACHPTLSGNGEEGAACETDQDCNGSQQFFCVSKGGMNGTCQLPVNVENGLKCEAANEVCADDDFFCDGNCNIKGDVGDTCALATAPCLDTARCDATSLQCVAKQDNGTGCTMNDECSGGFCDRAVGAIDGSCKGALPIVTTNGECAPFTP